jgi:pyoverdine/dityrosine biosynthesis protein Dit1
MFMKYYSFVFGFVAMFFVLPTTMHGSSADQSYDASTYPSQAMKLYASSLPKIIDFQTLQLEKTITNFLCAFSPVEAKFGQHVLEAKTSAFIAQGEPVALLLVGFALKSSNTQCKTLSGKLDFAEYVGLFTLNHMCEQIASVYSPGAHVTLYTREVQTDYANALTMQQVGVELFPQEDMMLYQEQLRKLVSYCFPALKIGVLDSAELLYENARKDYEREHSGSLLEESDAVALKNMKVFWREDLCKDPRFQDAAKKKFCSKKKVDPKVNAHLNELADQVSLELLIGSKITRTILESNVPNYTSYIRLSVHASADGNVSNKLGISLVHDSQGTPSHRILVFDSAAKKVCLLSNTDLQKMFDQELEFASKNYAQKTCVINDLSLSYIERS